jgi:hypothetical protein
LVSSFASVLAAATLIALASSRALAQARELPEPYLAIDPRRCPLDALRRVEHAAVDRP